MLKKEIPKDVNGTDNRTANLAEHIKNGIDDNKIKIIHKMADGTIRDSVEGYEIPYNEETAITYQLLAKWANEKQEN